MDQPSAVYANALTRIEALVLGLDEAALEKRVPACPEWTIKELVAHLTGVAADSLAANVEDLGKPDWTQSQVDSRKDREIGAILEEWKGIAAQVGPALDGIHRPCRRLLSVISSLTNMTCVER